MESTPWLTASSLSWTNRPAFAGSAASPAMWVDDSPHWKGLLKAVAEAPFARISTFDGNDSDNSVGLDGFKRVVVAKN